MRASQWPREVVYDKKNLIEFPSVLDLVYILVLLGLCTRFLCSYDLARIFYTNS